MKLSRTLAFLASIVFGLSAISSAMAQNAGQIINSPTGQEQIQVYPPNTAANAYMSVSSLRDGRQYAYSAPLTGATIVTTVDQGVLSLNPAATIAAQTITMPPTVVDGKTLYIFTSNTITTLTLNTSNSATFVPAAPTTLTANSTIGFVYDKANNQWHRIQ